MESISSLQQNPPGRKASPGGAFFETPYLQISPA
jgi:F0F1-type ATP synthase alpha subunit